MFTSGGGAGVPHRSGDQIGAYIWKGARAQAIWAAAVGALWVGAVASLPVDPDYTAGELLDHVMEWRSGNQLYPPLSDAPPYRVLNYPPTLLVLAVGLTEVGLPPLVAGRLIGTAGVLLTLFLVYRWLRRDGVSPMIAAGTIGLAGASFPLLYAAGQFHLEGFAVAATVGGLAGLSRATPRALAVGGGLLAAACLAKQTQVIPSVIAFAWLARYRGPEGWPALASFAVVGIAGVAGITGWFGAEAWRQMVTYTVGTYSLGEAASQIIQHGVPWAPVATAAFYAQWRLGSTADLRWWYLVGSTAWLAATARHGSGFQYFLDWQIATLLCLPPLLARSSSASYIDVRMRVVAQGYLFVANIVVACVLGYNIKAARSLAAELPRLCAQLPPPPALVPIEFPGLARACGARPALHPFIMADLARRGMWSDSAFVAALRRGTYPVVVLPHPGRDTQGVHGQRWTPATLSALTTYRVAGRIAGWYVFKPDEAAPSFGRQPPPAR